MCTFAALAACFSLSGIYFDVGTEVLANQHRAYQTVQGTHNIFAFQADGSTPIWERNFFQTTDSNDRKVSNPYGSFSIGYEIDFGKVRIDAGAYYQNSFSVADKGDKGGELHVRFFPFR